MPIRLLLCMLCLFSSGLVFPALAEDSSQQGANSEGDLVYRLRCSVMSMGGVPGSNNLFQTNGSIGQPTPIGVGAAENLVLYPGYWKNFSVYWLDLEPREESVPQMFENSLSQNLPNPFNPSTTIRYSVEVESPVEIIIFNVSGQRVSTLLNEIKQPGEYVAVWDGRDDFGNTVASGIYFYRTKIGSYEAVKKMLLLR